LYLVKKAACPLLLVLLLSLTPTLAYAGAPSWLTPGKYAKYLLAVQTSSINGEAVIRIEVVNVNDTSFTVETVVESYTPEEMEDFILEMGGTQTINYGSEEAGPFMGVGGVEQLLQSLEQGGFAISEVSLTTEAGTFNCYKASKTEQGASAEIYVEKDTGWPIKVFLVNVYGTMNFELIDTNFQFSSGVPGEVPTVLSPLFGYSWILAAGIAIAAVAVAVTVALKVMKSK